MRLDLLMPGVLGLQVTAWPWPMCWPRSCTGRTVLTGRGVGAGVRLAATLCARDLLWDVCQPWVDPAHLLHARGLLVALTCPRWRAAAMSIPRTLLGHGLAGLGWAHLGFSWLCAGPIICCCAQLLRWQRPGRACSRCVSMVCLPAARLPSCNSLRCILQVSKQRHGDGSGSLGIPDDSRSEKSESCQHESMGL